MRNLLLAISSCVVFLSCKNSVSTESAGNMNTYFQNIREDSLALQSFFQKMPKGGDIHHHSQGSVPAEDYIHYALLDSLQINPETYFVYRGEGDSNTVEINQLLKENPILKDSLIDYWTVRGAQKRGLDGHDWFFSTFARFLPIFNGRESDFLSKICVNASKENITYLETMVSLNNLDMEVFKMASFINPEDSTKDFDQQLKKWLGFYGKMNVQHLAKTYRDSLDAVWERTEKKDVELRFQLYGVRVIPNNAIIFGQLLLAFETAQISDKVVGVNFLAPEDMNFALEEYSEHMQMFAFLHKKYPEVKISLHSGELVAGKGSAKDADLDFHIFEALQTAGASRIGHGVDLAFEDHKDSILTLMKKDQLAVEINLESNAVILERTPENHPIRNYYDAGVPICISSDDAGVLRSSLSNQYVLLTQYMPELSYDEIKEIAFNSIEYSFLDEEEKQELNARLEKDFYKFEESILN